MELTRELPVDVRFIELMPIGEGKAFQGRDKEELLAVIRKVYPDFKETAEKRGNGPAVYGKVPGLCGLCGLYRGPSRKILQFLQPFASHFGRFFKALPLLQKGCRFKGASSGRSRGKELEEALCQAILQKPEAHHFQERDPEREAEETFMARIGG